MATSGTVPVRHTVMIKLKDKADTQIAADRLRTLQNELPEVTFLSFNVVTDLGLVETNADISVIADFPDKENFLKYAKHPKHLAVIASNKDLVANRLGIQYDPPAKL